VWLKSYLWNGGQMSDDLVGTENHEAGLARIADFCRVALDRTGVDAMAVTYANSFSGLELLLATDDLAERVAQLEFALGQGPTLDAGRSGEFTSADDLDGLVSARRWPLFSAEAVMAGVRAVQAYPLNVPGGSLGTACLYSQGPARLSSAQHLQAQGVAELISLALVDPDSGESIGSGLRMTVHQAAGMVMLQAGVSIQDALVLLRSTAFTEDVRVTDLAADVIAGRRRFDEVGSDDTR
jgi:hypothetical protein